jgi:hypothetical protein
LATKIGDLKISNSWRGVRFDVTRVDIEQGQPNDPCSCAAALALRRKFKAELVYVFRNVTYVVKGKEAVRFKTPTDLRLETIIFDRGGHFHPGQYDLYAAPLIIAQERKPQRSRARSGSSPKRRNVHATRHRIPDVRPTASAKLSLSGI